MHDFFSHQNQLKKRHLQQFHHYVAFLVSRSDAVVAASMRYREGNCRRFSIQLSDVSAYICKKVKKDVATGETMFWHHKWTAEHGRTVERQAARHETPKGKLRFRLCSALIRHQNLKPEEQQCVQQSPESHWQLISLFSISFLMSCCLFRQLCVEKSSNNS